MKPCPFCGNTMVRSEERDCRSYFETFIICDNCNARGPASSAVFRADREAEAETLWNTRQENDHAND